MARCKTCGHTKKTGCSCDMPEMNCPVCKNYSFFAHSRTQAVHHIIECMEIKH